MRPSEPRSGWVPIQQPILPVASSTNSALPARLAIISGKPPTPSDTARPESPQPSSSTARAWILARTGSGMSGSGSASSPRDAPVANTSQMGEPGAMDSSADIASSAMPAGRMTSVANLCTACCSARSSSLSTSKPESST